MVTDPAAFPEGGHRRTALALSALLLMAGVLVGVSPTLGIVATADSSPTTAAVGAAFVAVLPGLLALALAFRRSTLGLAATAGAGVVGLVRLLTDLAVLLETDRITRPELFAETTDRARPFTAGVGAWLLVGADVLWLTAGVLAAIGLARVILTNAEPRLDPIFGDAMVAAPTGDPEPPDTPDVAPALAGPAPGRRPVNLVMVSVGFLGAVLLMVGSLGTPYSGGYLALRILPFGSSLTGLVAAVLLGFLAALIVVVAAALPRAVARALLAGSALAAAVPDLTAVVAVLTGAPTSLSPVVWCGLAGAVILAAAGLLARGPTVQGRATDADGSPPRRWLSSAAGTLGVLAALALTGASQLSLLYLDGTAPDEVAGAALAPAALPQLVAAIPLAIAGLLALVGPTARLGRAAMTVVWAGAVYAFGLALWARSLVLATAGDQSTSKHSWTAGPGHYLLLLGTALAVAAAVVAAVATRRLAQASLDVVDDDTLSASRASRRGPAVGLTVVILVALVLPVYRTLAGSAPGLLHGYDLDTWGFWALAVGGVGAVWAAASTRHAGAAAAWLVSGAAVIGQPLVVPGVIREAPGFDWSGGLWCGATAVILLVAAAPYFAVLANRVRSVDLPPLTGSFERPVGMVRATAKSRGR